MTAMLLSAALLLVNQTDRPQPAPLNEEQLTRLRELIRTTQEAAAALQTRLDELERSLAGVYAEYELDERKAGRLQAAIVDLQRQKLANHHKMQTELRTIVGKERFDVLKQRLRLIVQPPSVPPKERSQPK